MSRNRLKHFIGRWARTLRPIKFGQTRGGLLTAALLLAAWQLADTASARQANPGFSQNDFFRVDWDYDLAAGTGLINIRSRFRYGERTTIVLLDDFDFMTFDQDFDSIHVRDSFTQFRVDPVGNDFQYSPDPYLAFINEATIDVTFPTQGIELLDTGLDFGGHGYYAYSTSFFPFVMPPSSMNFVSIKAVVPEPSGAASLLLGAIVAGAVTRRRS